MFFYIKYIWFCFRLMFNLHHYKDFLGFDPKRGKKYVLESRNLTEKIRSSHRRKEKPKMTHAFLMMFYDTINKQTMKEFKNELEAMFALTYMWHLNASKVIEEDEGSKMRE